MQREPRRSGRFGVKHLLDMVMRIEMKRYEVRQKTDCCAERKKIHHSAAGSG
ncbi:hypothetical protein WDD9_000639 [Paenibacillus melissococcoides]|nr:MULTISPECIES: hypothetical protein [Paenibacillus]MEB9895125.1 hypothetical protein [Bacillus cereus]CAH8704431.1 hypothetical protein WDD9_000639 [Paenibacillus melissococcoides]CAH8707700.1 hypothetical protein HTL2_001724 [Paenibacillus melissococcoides]